MSLSQQSSAKLKQAFERGLEISYQKGYDERPFASHYVTSFLAVAGDFAGRVELFLQAGGTQAELEGLLFWQTPNGKMPLIDRMSQGSLYFAEYFSLEPRILRLDPYGYRESTGSLK